MTTNELFRSLMQRTLDALEKRSRVRGWRVSVQCSCDETGTLVWSIVVAHEMLRYAPGHLGSVSRSRLRVPDGLVDMIVNVATATFDQGRAAVEELSRKGA